MKLKDILYKADEEVTIEYRTLGYIQGVLEDDLFGFCLYFPGENKLKPLDGDIYSLEDEIDDFKWENPNRLIVWQEVEYLSGEEWSEIISEFRKHKFL